MANVWPIISGTIVDRRDHVLRIFFSPPAFMCSIRLSKRASTNGPLDTERGMLFLPPVNDEFPGSLRPPGLVSFGLLAPRRHRMRIPGPRLSFSSAMRMVDRVHSHSPDVGPPP